MLIKTILFCLFLAVIGQPTHFRAYEVSAHGTGWVVDPESAKYTNCNIDFVFGDKTVSCGHQIYTVDHREDKGDAMRGYACYQIRNGDSIFCTIAVYQPENKKYWQILMVWEDSTKAFRAVAL
jgi:hypothetical protein